MTLAGRYLSLVIGGGIAAYKSLELIRLLRCEGATVRAVLTRAGAEFITSLSLQALTEQPVHSELFSLTEESEMGHIELSRAADLVIVAPATAGLMAKMAAGLADDLASTLLLATDKPVLIAPAMNVRMWLNPATQANLALLRGRGVALIGPEEGEMACGEWGPGRMAEPAAIRDAIGALLAAGPLAGRHAIVTSGPTHEPIDPVRYLGNRSSGRQGHTIAAELAALGARVSLISGPVALSDPPGVAVTRVETAVEMQEAALAALPADIAVCAAAVADWRVEPAPSKLKKGLGVPVLTLAPTPDILAELGAAGSRRPRLVIGFAAETENLLAEATLKRERKGCDWILANDVGAGSTVMGGAENRVHLITAEGSESWPPMAKEDVARRLACRIAAYFAAEASQTGSPKS